MTLHYLQLQRCILAHERGWRFRTGILLTDASELVEAFGDRVYSLKESRKNLSSLLFTDHYMKSVYLTSDTGFATPMASTYSPRPLAHIAINTSPTITTREACALPIPRPRRLLRNSTRVSPRRIPMPNSSSSSSSLSAIASEIRYQRSDRHSSSGSSMNSIGSSRRSSTSNTTTRSPLRRTSPGAVA
jgi:hypothetical protein